MRSTRPDGRIGICATRAICVGDAYLQMGTPPPPFDALRHPHPRRRRIALDRHDGGRGRALPAALGDLLTLEVVPGGHSVLWDAFDETAAAIDAFLEA